MNPKLLEEINDLFHMFGQTPSPNIEKMNKDELSDELKKLFVNALQDFDAESFAEKAYCIKQLIRPSSLFQYRNFDDDGNSLKALENNYVWLSAPNRFNDPYDCSACFDFEKMLAATFIDNNKNSDNPKIQKSIKDLNSGKSFFDIKNQNPFFNHLKDILEKISQKKFYEYTDKFRNKGKIGCFSETNKSILMWSHYAGKHTGFCVEYNIKGIPLDNDFNMNLFPVIYSEKPLDLSKALINKREDILGLILYLVKYIDWKYEKEWRYIGETGIDNKYTMPVMPKCIYLGTMITEENENKIKEITNRIGIECKKMQLKPYSFELEEKD